MVEPTWDWSHTTGQLIDALVALKGKKYISVTTYRKNGNAVPTPVEFILRDGAVYFLTLGSSGKVQRIRRNFLVQIAPCTIRGKIVGPSFDRQAELLDESASLWLRAEFAHKYGPLWRLVSKLRKPRSQGVKISLIDEQE